MDFHRLAAVGNGVALLTVVLFAAGGPALFQPPPGQPTASPFADGRSDRAVLVIVDGLRADVARDTRLMPNLSRIARSGGRGTTRIGSLIPSTIAGIESMVTGTTPPAIEFIEDFRALPATDGGVFAALARAGGTSRVAGPALWLQRFGRWVTPAGPGAIGEHDDAAVRDAAVADEAHPDWRLLVVHLSGADDAAHASGGVSAEYRRAAQFCDDAIGRIDAQLPPNTALIVTADHGVTDGGGHAGREPEVVNAPIVTGGAGVPHGELGAIPQTAVAVLLARAMGISLRSNRVDDSTPTGSRDVCRFGLIALGAVGLCGVLGGVAGGASGRPQAFYLNTTLWFSLVTLAAGQWLAAGVVAAGALCLARFRPRAEVVVATCVALAAGAVLGGLRLATASPAALPETPAVLAMTFAVGLALGRMAVAAASGFVTSDQFARQRWLFAGAGLAAVAVPLALAMHHTPSLSTIDVRPAFRLEGGASAAVLAAALVLLVQAAPILSVTLGALPAVPRSDWPAFVAGAASVFAGQAILGGAVLALTRTPTHTAALALGLVLNAVADSLFLLTCAAVLGVLANWIPQPIVRGSKLPRLSEYP